MAAEMAVVEEVCNENEQAIRLVHSTVHPLPVPSIHCAEQRVCVSSHPMIFHSSHLAERRQTRLPSGVVLTEYSTM